MRAADLRGFGPVGTNGQKAPCPLAAWDARADSIANRRDECIERGLNVQAELYREMIAAHREARAKVVELVEADRELDEAQDEAKQALLQLGPPGTKVSATHPAVQRVERARNRRAAALAAFSEMKP